MSIEEVISMTKEKVKRFVKENKKLVIFVAIVVVAVIAGLLTK